MTLALARLALPLAKAMAPASRSRPISLISSPSSPLVIAAMGCTLTSAVSRARRRMKSTSATSSITGSVLGMQTMVVTPPAAAARLAVASVSRCSCPGSPVNTIMSMRPGASRWPPQSTISASPTSSAVDLRAEIDDQAVPDQQAAGLHRGREPGSSSRALTKASAGALLWRARLHRRHWFGRWRASACSTAMRTATPISTCSRITLRASSATLESISTPRFIGPGCMTRASGLARASFS